MPYELYELLFNKTPLPTWVARRRDLRFLDVNDAALQLYGFAKEEFLQMTAFDLQRNPNSDLLHSATQSKNFKNYSLSEIVHYNKPGEVVYVELQVTPLKYQNEDAYLVIAKDVTQLRIKEDLIRKHQKLLEVSQEIGKMGSFEITLTNTRDWSKNFIIASKQAYSMHELDVQEAIKFTDVLKRIHKEDREKILKSIDHLNLAETTCDIDYRISLLDQSIKYIHSRLTVDIDPETSQPTKILGIIQDVTSQKKIEMELENHNIILQEEVEKHTHDLILANKSLNEFNHSISHDLRTPLRAIDMFLHILREELEGSKVNLGYLDKLDASVSEMKDMISSLLNFSKYSTIVIKKERVDMGVEIKKCIDQFKINFPNRQIKFNISETPVINVDRVLIKNVLNNLIGNAIKYSSKKSSSIIEIFGNKEEKYTTYCIKDNGDGFDENLNHKLFKPFSRLHNDSEFEGTGAGLAIVERIIARHGGSIWAKSKKGEGATFCFKLPNQDI